MVGCWSLFSCCVSRGTWVMLVKGIFCDCGRVLWKALAFTPYIFLKPMKLVLWDGCGVFAQTNVGLVRVCHLVSCFLGFVVLGSLVVFSGV